MKKGISIVLCAVMILAMTSVFADDRPINVTIDGVAMEFSDYYGYPVEHQDRVMLPFRQIFEKFGWNAYYEEETESIFGVKGNDSLSMQKDNKNYFLKKDGVEQKIEFDVAPIIVNDRTMVPIRVVSESLGYKVDYDDATRTVIVDTTAAN